MTIVSGFAAQPELQARDAAHELLNRRFTTTKYSKGNGDNGGYDDGRSFQALNLFSCFFRSSILIGSWTKGVRRIRCRISLDDN